MNKRLDDVFSQADEQLRELESEIHEKESAQAPEQEVDRETLLQLQSDIANGALKKRHRYVLAFTSVLMALYLAAQIYVMATAPRTTGPYHMVIGTVQSRFVFSSGRMRWGSRTASKVMLPNGSVVIVPIDSGNLPPVGTPVALRVYDTGAVRLYQSM